MNKTRRNLFMLLLCRLCGDNALARVVLGTTHWEDVDEDGRKMHEQQLAKTWNDSSSKLLRFDLTESCARAFLDVILCQLEFGGNEKIPEGHGLPRFTPSRSTIVEDSTIKNDPKRTSMNDHQIIILCAFSRLLIAIGTDMWD